MGVRLETALPVITVPLLPGDGDVPLDLQAVFTRCYDTGPYRVPRYNLFPAAEIQGSAAPGYASGYALEQMKILANERLPVYGDGLHVRDWIYVLDHCAGIDAALRKGTAGEVYNIGAGYDVPNLQIVKRILALLDKPETLIEYVKDRPGHDRRYAMDSAKLQRTLGWKPAFPFDDALRATVDWYVHNRAWWERVRSGEYTKAYETLYGWRDRKAP